MSAITASTCRSRWITVAHARMSAYVRPRWIRGCTSRRRCCAAPPALADDLADHERERARDVVGVGEVGEVVLADPPRPVALEHRAHRQQAVRRVAGEDVRPARAVGVQQPAPVGVAALELLRVRGWLVTIAAPRSFSHQRNAGMSSLSPCSSPAWQAPVCDDQSVSHRVSRWPPSRSQRASFGALPSRIARSRTSWARPSISRKNSPARRSRPPGARRAWRRTTLRCQKSSSSMASSEVDRGGDERQPSATRSPRRALSTSHPGSIAATPAARPRR